MRNDWKTELAQKKAAILTAIDDFGLSVTSRFVPFSQSRNAENDHLSLNWKVTILHRGREVVSTDYSAGVAHCPSYDKKPHGGFHGSHAIYRKIVTRAECEQGRAVKRVLANDSCLFEKNQIEPDSVDVFYSLMMDSNVLDFPTFEEWAQNYGYDEDSRKAESIYRACLEIALKFRAAIGDEGLRKLTDLFQDY